MIVQIFRKRGDDYGYGNELIHKKNFKFRVWVDFAEQFEINEYHKAKLNLSFAKPSKSN